MIKSAFLLLTCFTLSARLFAGAYGEYRWRNIEDPLRAIQSPSLAADEKIRLFDSIIRIGDRVLSIVRQGGATTILAFNVTTGAVERIRWPNGAINGWTSDDSGNLAVLSNGNLLTVEPSQFGVTAKRPLPGKLRGWFDLVVMSGVIYLQNPNTITAYDLRSLEKLWEFDASGKKMQRMVAGEGGKLYVSSTYWGAIIREFDPARRDWGRTLRAATHHHNLMRTTGLKGNLLAVYDFDTGQIFSLMLYDGMFVSLQQDLQMLDNGNAVRYSPQVSQVNAVLTVTAKKDTPEIATNVLLPQRATYSQAVSAERMIGGAEEKADEFGNRVLQVVVPALRAGETWTQTVWSGTLARYMVSFRLDAPQPAGSQSNPAEVARFLKDSPYYKLQDVAVQSKKDELMAPTSAEYIQNVYQYAAKMPYAKGAFEAAPKVLAKYKGGCTEHSYAQIALLRSAGYPARLVWNFLPPARATQFEFNHKFTEVYVAGLGWIPLEPLAPPRSKAGTTHARHVVWATLETPAHPMIKGGDRLASVADGKNAGKVKVSVTFQVENAAPVIAASGEEANNLPRPVVREVDGESQVQ